MASASVEYSVMRRAQARLSGVVSLPRTAEHTAQDIIAAIEAQTGVGASMLQRMPHIVIADDARVVRDTDVLLSPRLPEGGVTRCCVAEILPTSARYIRYSG